MRLDKYLCEAGLGTRSQVKKLLKSGVVTVNGQTVLRPEERLEETDRVAVSGRELSVARLEYWMLNKPAGCVSATEDARFQTVTELLPAEARRDLFPVGRLDRDTEGLLLLTNDGKLAHFLLSPKRHVDKVYYARVRGRVTKEHVKLFAEGLDIGECWRSFRKKRQRAFCGSAGKKRIQGAPGSLKRPEKAGCGSPSGKAVFTRSSGCLRRWAVRWPTCGGSPWEALRWMKGLRLAAADG